MRTVRELARELDGVVVGDDERVLNDVAAIGKASAGDLSFVSDALHLPEIQRSAAGAVIVDEPAAAALNEEIAPSLIVVADPLESFIHACRIFKPANPKPPAGVAPTAFVAPTAKVGHGSSIAAGAWIGAHVTVGERCQIGPGVVVKERCTIGDDVVLHPHVVLYANTEIGHRTIIHACAVIAADGFGYRIVDGQHKRIPHVGSVIIEDDVEIGACTTIDRGMIGPTRIGRGTKIDNLVMIAHNCEVGEHSIFASQVGLAGSVTTGAYVQCGGQAGIRDHVHLGTASSVGAKSGVHRDVPDRETHIGSPARPSADTRRILMSLGKLPEMRQRLRQLEKEMAELSDQLGVGAGPKRKSA